MSIWAACGGKRTWRCNTAAGRRRSVQRPHLQLPPQKAPTGSLAVTAPVRLPAQQSSLGEMSLRAVQLPRALHLPACSRQAWIMTWRKHTLTQGRSACPLPTMQPGRL